VKTAKPFLGQRKMPNRFCVEFDTFKRWSWRDRLRILFGFNLVVRVNIMVDKRDGRSWTSCLPGLTPLTTEKAVIDDLRKFDMAVTANQATLPSTAEAE
jgi:hypothetical protein